MNTRNRPKRKTSSGISGVVGVVSTLNEVCSHLEMFTEHLFPYIPRIERKKARRRFDRILDSLYEVCTAVEKLGDVPLEPIAPTLMTTQRTTLIPAQPQGDEPYINSAGKVEGQKLLALAKAVGPWECGDAVCWKCPHGGSLGPEMQRRECLDYYRARQVKKLAVEELASGIPYKREQLEALPRADLTTLTDVLHINKFKMKDRRTAALIGVILEAQSLREKAK